MLCTFSVCDNLSNIVSSAPTALGDILHPVITQSIVPFLSKNNEYIFVCALGRWLTATSSFTTATAYRSLTLSALFHKLNFHQVLVSIPYGKYDDHELHCAFQRLPFTTRMHPISGVKSKCVVVSVNLNSVFV